MTVPKSVTSAHDATIADQFSRQAAQFAASAVHHNQAALDLLVEAAGPRPEEISLDVACGPGSVVAAFAQRLHKAEGLDTTEAMLDEARKLAAREGLRNVAWHRGDVYELPFEHGAFDIVSCRYAFHHLLEPARALAEMVRVCRDGGRIVLCDAFASDDPANAAAFNAMERTMANWPRASTVFPLFLSKAAIHMVSAFAARQRLVLGQLKVADKSNEVTRS
jgi:ubiquinone/menaquinone biosynthesis C-methylase UbiE